MEISSPPLVSIALCTYFGERFLIKQLESIINQDYNNLEIIVVDDCSADGTWAILNTYLQKDPRIKLYRNEQNLGYAKNFEKAIKLCTGEFIALADQDDIWQKNKISLCVDGIADYILIYHNSDFIDENDDRIDDSTMGSRYRMYEGDSCLPFILSNCISGHAMLFRKEIKNYIFPFDERFYHDWWLAYVAFNTGRVKYMDKVLVHYRQHAQSITDSLKLKSQDLPLSPSGGSIRRISLDLDWLKYCAGFKFNKKSGLLKEANYLFENLSKGNKRLKSFQFLMKYFDLIFYICYQPKSTTSKLNMVRKICFR